MLARDMADDHTTSAGAKGFTLTVALPVQWGDMDALGHVNNTCYLRWFESARIALFRHLGLGSVTRPEGVGPILATQTCDYLRPLVFPADVVVGVRTTRVGTTSVTMEYAIWVAGAPETPVARGTSVVVLVEYASGARVPVPAELRARLERG
jgi:acyl-CoA thioester hydrolase